MINFSRIIDDKEIQYIEECVGKGKTEEWITQNVDSLIKQCENICRQKKIDGLGSLSDVEIELIKKSRT